MTTSERATSRFHLRSARDSDVEQLGAIERTSFADPWPASAFRDMLHSPRARLTVAVDANDRAAGYCVLLVAADEGEIANLAVALDVRKQGLGALLLDHALQQAASDGAVSVYLEVRASNDAAQRLYSSRGFSVVGRRRGYYQHPIEDALVLRWNAPSVLSQL